MKRGEIYWAALHRARVRNTRAGDRFNETRGWRSVIVVPKAQAKRGPTAVAIPGGSAGLTRAGIAVCHQVTTLDRAKLTRYSGTLSQELLRSVEDGLRAALDLE